MLRTMALILLGFSLCACTSQNTAYQAADNLGFKQINVGFTSIFGCGKHEFFGRSFTAININGKPVSGVVCSGLFKGATVRFY